MRLQKMLRGAFFVAFFFLVCQGVRLILPEGRELVCNPVGAFGVGLPSLVLFVGIVGALFFFGVQWWRERSLFGWPWLVLVAGGASNLFERLLYGCVTDYIHLGAFPIFNLADVLLTIGVGGVILSVWGRRD